MAVHYSLFGVFGASLPVDLEGYVAEDGDYPGDFVWPHDDFAEGYPEGAYDGGYDRVAWARYVALCVSLIEDVERALGWRSSLADEADEEDEEAYVRYMEGLAEERHAFNAQEKVFW